MLQPMCNSANSPPSCTLLWLPTQVARSVEYVQSGTSALQDAKQLQKSTRKWMCCGIITLLIVAAIIVIFVVKPWQLAAVKNNNQSTGSAPAPAPSGRRLLLLQGPVGVQGLPPTGRFGDVGGVYG